MLHHYVITEPVPELIELERELPVVRDPYAHAYLREETHGVLVGPYETATAHVCWDGNPPPADFENELIAPELDRLTPWLEKASERLPLFGKAGLKSIVSGAITHTPDGVYLSGPAAGPRNYWMHCGASIGICQAGGAGKYLAQWMVHGQAEINMREFDPRRFGDWATREYTAEVAIADYHHMYHCYKPGEQHEVGRGLRKSSLYETLKAAGAQFSQINGWERPRWYDPSGKGEVFSFKRSNWFEAVRQEALAVRERVGPHGSVDLLEVSNSAAPMPTPFSSASAPIGFREPGRRHRARTSPDPARASSRASSRSRRLEPKSFYVLSAAVAQLHDLDQFRWRLRPGRERRDQETSPMPSVSWCSPVRRRATCSAG